MNKHNQRLSKLQYLIKDSWERKDWNVCLDYMNEYERLFHDQRLHPNPTVFGMKGTNHPSSFSKSSYIVWRFAQAYKNNVERFTRLNG